MDIKVKLINKPSFVSEDENGEVDLFLDNLVAEFDLPKRFVHSKFDGYPQQIEKNPQP